MNNAFKVLSIIALAALPQLSHASKRFQLTCKTQHTNTAHPHSKQKISSGVAVNADVQKSDSRLEGSADWEDDFYFYNVEVTAPFRADDFPVFRLSLLARPKFGNASALSTEVDILTGEAYSIEIPSQIEDNNGRQTTVTCTLVR